MIRDRVGQREDRFFATVFLGSGLLFVAMLFAAAAIAGGLFAAASRSSGPPGADTVALGRDVTGLLVNIYAMRMAAVSTVTIARRTQIVSRWLTAAGIAAAVVLLIGVGISAWAELLFPAWILALSLDILASGRKVSPGSTATAPKADRPQCRAGRPPGVRSRRLRSREPSSWQERGPGCSGRARWPVTGSRAGPRTWRRPSRSAWPAPAFLARVNSSCRTCPVASCCPVCPEGEQVTP